MSIEPMDWQAPAPGTEADTAGDLRWIRLPVPGALGHINVWLACYLRTTSRSTGCAPSGTRTVDTESTVTITASKP